MKNNSFDNYKGLTTELTNYMRENENIDEGTINNLNVIFNESFNKVYSVFSTNIFKFFDPIEKKFNNTINRSVMDIQMCVLSKYSIDKIKRNKNKILEDFKRAFSTEEFRESLKIHTNNIEAIRKRFSVMDNLLEKIMGK
ncbi:hypothetical protein [Spiroplasma sp. SV19]|uniref:hypothetical protein n=1 Tax=Spiroplasma sp. SV19 TaxID=2570468 RepID=UPI0024B72A38|nr:hypothetical protein [Spiroplasma sp. SV19]WHQ37487.1 hypothetical protein E7Y35_06545 [Spiroplasma sp. SV19]